MIKITRPATPPILLNKGASETTKNCKDYDNNPSDYINGIKKFEFDSDIYGHKSVKDELKKAQNEKCAFCESKVTHISYGDVEHFRPKGGFKNDEIDPLSNVGYYWLAYDWNNLLLSCQICNQRYKKNLFPLSNKKSRAKNHNEDISKEKPIFINPYNEDPKKHIGYRKEIPYGKTKRGELTIKELGLDRKELNEIRLEKYKIIKCLNMLVKSNIEESKEAKKLLNDLISESSEYSLMKISALNNI